MNAARPLLLAAVLGIAASVAGVAEARQAVVVELLCHGRRTSGLETPSERLVLACDVRRALWVTSARPLLIVRDDSGKVVAEARGWYAVELAVPRDGALTLEAWLFLRGRWELVVSAEARRTRRYAGE